MQNASDPWKHRGLHFRKLGARRLTSACQRVPARNPPEFFGGAGEVRPLGPRCAGNRGLYVPGRWNWLGEEWRPDLQRALDKTETTIDSMQPYLMPFTPMPRYLRQRLFSSSGCSRVERARVFAMAESAARRTLESSENVLILPVGFTCGRNL